jgi:hypothetical protein
MTDRETLKAIFKEVLQENIPSIADAVIIAMHKKPPKLPFNHIAFKIACQEAASGRNKHALAEYNQKYEPVPK